MGVLFLYAHRIAVQVSLPTILTICDFKDLFMGQILVQNGLTIKE